MLEATGYAPVDLELEEKLGRSLAELNLSVRATNCLESEGINTVRDLVIRSEDQLLQVRNFGDTTLQEVRERLSSLSLRLGMRLPQSMQQRDR
jgi:DNA-directed RNA polymerase subunit alpha